MKNEQFLQLLINLPAWVNPISFVLSIGGAHLAHMSCIEGKQNPYKESHLFTINHSRNIVIYVLNNLIISLDWHLRVKLQQINKSSDTEHEDHFDSDFQQLIYIIILLAIRIRESFIPVSFVNWFPLFCVFLTTALLFTSTHYHLSTTTLPSLSWW